MIIIEVIQHVQLIIRAIFYNIYKHENVIKYRVIYLPLSMFLIALKRAHRVKHIIADIYFV